MPVHQSHRDIRQAVLDELLWDVLVPDKRIRSTVSEGAVTFEGEVSGKVHSWAELQAVRGAVAGTPGVRDVVDAELCTPAPQGPLLRRRG